MVVPTRNRPLNCKFFDRCRHLEIRCPVLRARILHAAKRLVVPRGDELSSLVEVQHRHALANYVSRSLVPAVVSAGGSLELIRRSLLYGALRFDVAIIGAGILGLATGYQLLEAVPDLRLVILEQEGSVGAHQSSHNSGVVHAGVYYSPGSLKARLCREGAQLLYDFADRHNIPYGRTG